MAEQNFADPSIVFGPSFTQLINDPADIGRAQESFFQPVINWFSHFFNDSLQAIVTVLSGIVKNFFLNPNLTRVDDSTGDLSLLLKPLVNIIYGIAIDLMFVLFIIAIWQYWTQASWRGNISAMSAIGRLIFTIGVLFSWATVYSFEIDLSNDMINAILANGADQLSLFDTTMANMVNISAYSGLLNLPAISPSIAAAVAPLSNIMTGIGIILLAIFMIILLYELVYLIVLKAIQTGLLTAQYVFGPLFIIFFASPSTENMASGYMRTFAETSVWSFIWIGLLKILLILLYSSFNPLGKILTTIGILQLMIRVPEFLGRFKISAASDFVNPGVITNLFRGAAHRDGDRSPDYKSQFVSAVKKVFKGEGMSEAFSSMRSNMAADFGFGNAPVPATAGANMPPPPFNKREPFVRHSQSQTGMETPGNVKSGNANMNVDQSINPATKSAARTHFGKRNFPDRKNPPKKQDIFSRHSRGSLLDRGDTFNWPASRQLPYGMPEGVAALLSNNSLPGGKISNLQSLGSHNSGPDPFNGNLFNFSRPGSFDVGQSSSTGFSQFIQTPEKLNMAAKKSSLLSKQLLTTRVPEAQLKYGWGSILVGRQQFALPNVTSTNFSRHSHLPQYRTTAKFNRHTGSHIHQERPRSFNQHSPTLYYSSAVLPGWQRPYYRNPLPNPFAINTKPIASFYPDTHHSSARFRSYYS